MEIIEIISMLIFMIGTTLLASKKTKNPIYRRINLYIFMFGDVMCAILMLYNQLYWMFFAYIYMALISIYGIMNNIKEGKK